MNSGNRGLLNLGNTCYMNSVIQCLSHLLIFHPNNQGFLDACTNHCHKKNFDIIQEWLKLQKQLWSNKSSDPIDPREFLKCFIQKVNEYDLYFENFQQNDVDEFLSILIDILHRSLKDNIKINAYGSVKNEEDKIAYNSIISWKNFFEEDYSFFTKKLYSQLLTSTHCSHCDYCTHNHDPLMVIQLPVTNNTDSIIKCFDEYCKLESVDKHNQWKCDKCNQRVCPKKKTIFWKLSDIIIILLKRYDKNNQKINKHISYPEILDMYPYSPNYHNLDLYYKLSGFCVQSGTMNGGHYYSICKNDIDKQWYLYDDDTVHHITKEVALKKPAYCLFYKRNG
jgi:ubiquitin C-terminal hydrolase